MQQGDELAASMHPDMQNKGQGSKECVASTFQVTDTATAGTKNIAPSPALASDIDNSENVENLVDTKRNSQEININKIATDSLDSESNTVSKDIIRKRKLISKLRNSPRVHKFTDRPFTLDKKALALEKLMEEAEINKVAKLKTELSKLKYKFPKPENEAKDEDMCLTDDRTVLQVYGDVLGVIQDKYKAVYEEQYYISF